MSCAGFSVGFASGISTFRTVPAGSFAFFLTGLPSSVTAPSSSSRCTALRLSSGSSAASAASSRSPSVFSVSVIGLVLFRPVGQEFLVLDENIEHEDDRAERDEQVGDVER